MMGQSWCEKPHVDIFSGVDFNYRNIYYNNRLYDLLINLTPGVKWHPGHGWTMAVQGIVPIYNDYGDRYKNVRLNMASIAKEFCFGSQFLKVSGGLFSNERYGIDLKWFFPVTGWLAFEAKAGCTGFCSMADGWECSKMTRFSGQAGARVYLEKCNTEFRLQGGRYIFEDYGIHGECMRHFRHCTVSVYAEYSSIGKENGGFKVVMMIPPYKRKTRTVNVRPASNFRFVYNIEADPYSMRSYATDPEENEREGYFDRTKLQWGSNLMQPDFAERGGEK